MINLKRREDRLEDFRKYNSQFTDFIVFEATDGKILKPNHNIQELFSSGDYNYRRGIVGCALSHLILWNNFLWSEDDILLVLEDDVILVPNFLRKLLHLISNTSDFDILFLGHHLYPQYKSLYNRDSSENKFPEATEWFRNKCITQSVGGTSGYLLSRDGAKKLMNHVENNGFYNAVDWVMFKTARTDENDNNDDNCKIYYSEPHIVLANWMQNDNKVDTDIQNDYEGVGFKKWDEEVIKYWKNNDIIVIKHYSEDIPTDEDLISSVTIIYNKNVIDKIIDRLNDIDVYAYEINDKNIVVIGDIYVNEQVRKDIPLTSYLNYSIFEKH